MNMSASYARGSPSGDVLRGSPLVAAPAVQVEPNQIVFYFQNTGGKMRKQNWYWGKPKCMLTITDEFHADCGDDGPAAVHRQNRPQARVAIPKVSGWSTEDFLVVWEYKPNNFNFQNGDTIRIQDTRYVVPLKYIVAIEQERSGNAGRHILAPQLPADLHFNFTDLLYGCRRNFRFRANFVYIVAVMRLQHDFTQRQSVVEKLIASSSRHFTILAEPKLSRGQMHKEDQRKRNQKLLVKLASVPTPRIAVQSGERLPDKVRDSMYQLMEITEKETRAQEAQRGKHGGDTPGALPIPTLHHPHAFGANDSYAGSVRFGHRRFNQSPSQMARTDSPSTPLSGVSPNQLPPMSPMPLGSRSLFASNVPSSWTAMQHSPSPLALPPDIAMAQTSVPGAGDFNAARASNSTSPNPSPRATGAHTRSPLGANGYSGMGAMASLLPPQKRVAAGTLEGTPSAKRPRLDPDARYGGFVNYNCQVNHKNVVTFEDKMLVKQNLELRDGEQLNLTHENNKPRPELGTWRVPGPDANGKAMVKMGGDRARIQFNINGPAPVDAMDILNQVHMVQEKGERLPIRHPMNKSGIMSAGKHLELDPNQWAKLPPELICTRNGEQYINLNQLNTMQILALQQQAQRMDAYRPRQVVLEERLQVAERQYEHKRAHAAQMSRSRHHHSYELRTDNSELPDTEFENLTDVVAGMSNISLTVESHQKSLELQSVRAKFAKWYGPLQEAMTSELDQCVDKLNRREFLVKCQEFFNNAITLFGIQTSEGGITPLKKGRDIFPRDCQKVFLKKQRIFKDPINQEGVDKLKTYTYGLVALAVHMGLSFFNKQFLLGLPTTKTSVSEIDKQMRNGNTTLLRISSSQPHTIILCRKRSSGKISQTKIEGVMADYGAMIGWNLLFGKESEVSKPTFYRSLVAILKAVKFDNAKKFEFDPLVFNQKRAPDVNRVHAVLQGVL